MQVIIDRFEQNFMIIELPDKKTISVPKELFPQNVKEGDVIEVKIKNNTTDERRKRIGREFNNLKICK